MSERGRKQLFLLRQDVFQEELLIPYLGEGTGHANRVGTPPDTT